MARILYIEDDDWAQRAASRVFKAYYPRDLFVLADSLHNGIAAFQNKGRFDGILSDGYYGDGSAVETLAYMKSKNISIPLVVLTAGDPKLLIKKAVSRGVTLHAEDIFPKTGKITDAINHLKALIDNPHRPETKPAPQAAPVVS